LNEKLGYLRKKWTKKSLEGQGSISPVVERIGHLVEREFVPV